MNEQTPYEHPLVTALKVDPAQPPDLNPIQGYIGRSDEDKHVRIYRDSKMNVWVDVPMDQILYEERQVAPDPVSPKGQDVVWITSRTLRKLVVESSASGAHPELVDQPLIGLRRAGREPESTRTRFCPCCGSEQPAENVATPIGGGGGGKWPAR